MAGKIVQVVELDYVHKGLDQFEKTLEKQKKYTTDPKGLQLIEKMLSKAKGLRKVLEARDWKVSPSLSKEFDKAFMEIKKGFNKSRDYLVGNVSEAIQKQYAEASKAFEIAKDNYRKTQQNNTAKIFGVRRDKDRGVVATNESQRRYFDANAPKGIVGETGVSSFSAVTNMYKKLNSLKSKELNKLMQGKQLNKDELIILKKKLAEEKKTGVFKKSTLSVQKIINQARKQAVYFTKQEADANKRVKDYLNKQKNILQAKKALDDADLNRKKAIADVESNRTKDMKTGSGKDIMRENYEEATKAAERRNKVLAETKRRLNENTAAENNNKKSITDNSHSITNATKNVINYALVYQTLRRVVRQTIQTIKDLDSALTEMAIVTPMNRKETWELLGTFQELAKQTGFTTTEIAKLSTIYFRQGRQLTDVIELTKIAAKAARVAGISAADSANYLTSAINGFGLAAEQAESVSDKFAALAATSASSYEELAVGLSKFASQARIAGVNMDFALGMLAKGVETTREAPESIGTALKSVLARMRELKDFGKTLEDGMDISRVEGALKSINIQLRDSTGQFRDMQDVLTDVGNSWEGLNKNQQAATAVALAGIRQQSRLLAIMNDFPRTLELVKKAEDSAGATNAQHQEYMKSLQAAITTLTNAWQKFITNITQSEFVVSIVKAITGALNGLNKIIEATGPIGKNLAAIILLVVGSIKAKAFWTKTLIVLGFKQIAIDKLGNEINRESIRTKILELSVDKKTVKQQIVNSQISIRQLRIAKRLQLAKAKEIAQDMVSLNMGPLQIATLTFKDKATRKLVMSKFLLARAEEENVKLTMKYILTNFIAAVSAKGFSVAIKMLKNDFIKLAASTWAALAPLLPFILGITAAIGLIYLFIKGVKKMTISLSEVRNKYEALNYDLNQTNSSMKDLIDTVDELNSKPIKTDEDIKNLKNLEEQLGNFGKDKEYIITKSNLVDGRWQEIVDWDASIKALQKAIDDNSKEIKNNTSKIFSAAIRQGLKDGLEKGLSEENLNIISNFFSTSFEEYKGGDFSDKLTEGMTNYFKTFANQLDSVVYKKLRRYIDSGHFDEAFDLINEQFEGNVANIEDVYSTLNNLDVDISGSDTLLEQVHAYEKDTAGISDNLKAVTSQVYQTLDYLSKLDDSVTQMFQDYGWGADQINSLSSIIKQAGIEDVSSVLDKMGESYKFFLSEGESKNTAFIYTINELGDEFDNATDSIALFNLAMKETSLEIAQSIDHISSSIENLTKKQKSFIEGTLKQEDLYNFLQDYQDYLSDPQFISDFVSGVDLSKYLYKSLVDEYQNYQDQMNNINSILDEAATNQGKYTEEQLNGYKAQLAQLSLMSTYIGKFQSLSNIQKIYNEDLEQYNKLLNLNITDETLRNKLISESSANMLDIVANQTNTIQEIYDNFSKTGMGELNSFIETVNGVVMVKNRALYANLEPAQKKYLDSIIEALQSGWNTIFDTFKSWADFEVKAQKDALQDKYDLYKDYFDSLNRLKKQQDDEQTKEDIINQLQRLEGATDEYSKKRAKELRQQLNDLNKKTNDTNSTQAQTDFLDSIKTQMDDLASTYGNIIQGIIDAFNSDGVNGITTALTTFEEKEWITPEEKAEIESLFSPLTNVPTTIGFDSTVLESLPKQISSPIEEAFRKGGTEAARLLADVYRKAGLITNDQFNEMFPEAQSFQSYMEEQGYSLNSKAQLGGGGMQYLLEHQYAGMNNKDILSSMKKSGIVQSISPETAQSTPSQTYTLDQYGIPDFNNSSHEESNDYSSEITDFIENDLNPYLDQWPFIPLKSRKELINWISQDIQNRANPDRIQGDNSIIGGSGRGLLIEELISNGFLTNTVDRDQSQKFKKGGLVDYTGSAIVHGSLTKPEAFLNADQTQLFANLRDILSNVITKSGNVNSSINIENITIQTEKLDSNQDFNKAGETLAKAFSNAIKTRGLNLNIKR